MPIHDFECRQCSHTFEEVTKDGEDAVPCPECGGFNVIKKISAPHFIIHGYSAANGYSSKNRFGAGVSRAGEKII